MEDKSKVVGQLAETSLDGLRRPFHRMAHGIKPVPLDERAVSACIDSVALACEVALSGHALMDSQIQSFRTFSAVHRLPATSPRCRDTTVSTSHWLNDADFSPIPYLPRSMSALPVRAPKAMA